MKDKKGFIFTISIVLLLVVVVLSVFYYNKTITEREHRTTEKFKFIAVSQVLDMMSEEEISDYAEMSSFYALYSLNEFIIEKNEPLKQGSGPSNNKYTEFVNKSIYSLMIDGNVPNGYFQNSAANFAYNSDEKSKYVFKEWSNKIDKICAQLGYTCNISDVRNFSYTQNDSWGVNIYFEATTNVESNDGRFKREQNITVNKTYSIEGFNDPLVSILMKTEGSIDEARRQVFRYDGIQNPKPDDVDLLLLSEADKGKGFFYGPVVSLSDIKITTGGITTYYSDAKSSKYILSSRATEWNSLTTPEKDTLIETYGGFIVTNVIDECFEYNRTGSTSSPQTVTVTVCRGKPGQRNVDITVTCQGVCNYEDCTATNCPFDCYEGITDCNWRYDTVSYGGTLSPSIDCDGVSGLPFDFVGGDPLEEFKTHSDYAGIRANLCNHAGIESSISGLGTGSITNEVEKPYLFYFSGNSNFNSVPKPINYPVSDDFYGSLGGRRFVLINNENDHDVLANEAYGGYHELWNINDFRELVMCGSYVEVPEGPSFFQRMIYQGERLYSDDFGLETFIVGPFIDVDNDDLCQLDRDFINGETFDNLIKGMPGCNSFELTSTFGDLDDPVSQIGTGHFGLTKEVINRYNLEDILCGGDRDSARCD
ncbi:MAG: hypothetical protein WC356_03205 [Candidatus Micrarchaeia archaeon]|jgi:hypothetical protein